MIKGKSLPDDVVKKWPEVFSEITLDVVPLKYLHAVRIIFKNDKIWEIEIKKNLKEGDWDNLETQIRDIVSEYESEIEKIDFQLDTEKLKKDIIKKTDKFLKNKKLK